MQSKDPNTNAAWEHDGLVDFAVGGGQLDDKYIRRTLNKTMVGTMEYTQYVLDQLIAVKITAQKALNAGQTKMPQLPGISAANQKKVPSPGIVIENIENEVENPDARLTFTQWQKFQRMIDSKGWQMGHSALSVATAMTAIYLSANLRQPLGGDVNAPEQKVFREELRKLYLAQKQLDAITVKEWEEMGGASLAEGEGGIEFVLGKMEQLEDGFDITYDLDRDIDMMQGKSDLDGKISWEEVAFNQWKKGVNRKLAEQIREMWTSQAATRLEDSVVGGVLAYTRGSKSMMESIEEQIIDIAVKGGAKKYAKKTKTTTKVGKKIKGATQHKKKIQSLQKKLKREATALGKVQVARQSGAKNARSGLGSQQSDLQLLTLLKAKLPQTVAKNMGPPGLENRTGRFASSVTPTDVSRTAQGYPSVGYTYRKNPYQVFEMGVGDARWATPDRDPRKVIDMSIREIAAQLVVGRLYTRRQ